MQIFRDTVVQQQLEEQRLIKSALDLTEPPEGASTKEKMKHVLAQKLHKDMNNDSDAESINDLLLIFANDKDPDDGIFEGDHGNYDMGDGFVGADLFTPGTQNDSPQNINGVIELASIAKASFGDTPCFFTHGADSTLEQQQMNAYAADLVGLNVENNIDHSSLSPELKAKLDEAFVQMQQRLGNVEPKPELSANNNINAESGLTQHNHPSPNMNIV